MYAGTAVVVVGGTVVVVVRGAVVVAGRLTAAPSVPPPPHAARTSARATRPRRARTTWLRTRLKPSSVPSRRGSVRAGGWWGGRELNPGAAEAQTDALAELRPSPYAA